MTRWVPDERGQGLAGLALAVSVAVPPVMATP
jgi:hypothetical protein